MANNIIQTKDLIQQLNDVLAKHTGYLDSAASSLNKYVSSAKMPSEYVTSLKNIEQSQNKIVKSTKDLERAEKKMQRERIKDLKLATRRERAFDKYEKQLQREQRLLNRTEGLYNKVQRGITEVTRKYQDLAVRKELNGKLSAEEEISLGKLEAKLNKYQGALKRVDANIGKHQRNVGNYKSTFDGLGFSIAQLSREMPAFANSMQTGFMAISNNIPMLVDEITRLKQANVQLAASGKPTTNVLRAVGKAIFSMNGLLGIGITVLTVFGPKLLDWAFGMSEAEKATQKATEELEEQNKSLKENIRLRELQVGKVKSFLNDPKLNEAFKGALLNEDSERATLALIELSERLSAIGVKNADAIRDENILSKDRLNIAGNLLKINELQIDLDKERLKVNNNETNSLKETLRIQGRIKQLNEENERLIKKGAQITIDNEDKKQKSIEKTINVTKNSEEAFSIQIAKLMDLRRATEVGSSQWNIYNSLIEILQKSLKALKGELGDTKKKVGQITAEFPDFQKNMEKAIKTIEKLRRATEDYLSGFSQDFINQSPLGSLATFFDGTFDELLKHADTNAEKFAVSFNTIAESAQQAFSFISQLSQASFEQQYSQLEQQRNIAIQFAGESTSAREEIERQYEARRARIQRKQAEAQRDQAAFNVGVDTAQAIVATLAKTPPPAGLPLAALMAGIGAAQLIAIKSAQIPQFWMGTEGTPEGQIMVNDDPYGVKGSNYREVIKEPSGKLHFPQGKNVKMNVPKGSHVYSTYDAFMNSLDNELLSNNIMPIGQSNIMPMIVNNGLSKSDVLEVMNSHANRLVSTIERQHGVKINIDENGIGKYVTKNGTTKKIMNARYSGRGLNV